MNRGPLICQQCEESLQLDASLVDLAPSAYDMVVSNLPPSMRSRVQFNYEGEAINQLPAPAYVKSAWQRSRDASQTLNRALANHPAHRGILLPNESFVILQDSILVGVHGSKVPNLKMLPPTQGSVLPKHDIAEPDQNSPSPLSHNLRSHMRLFSLLSAQTDVDHPLCSDCAQMLSKALQKQLEELNKERDGYIAFEKEVRKEKEKAAHSTPKDDLAKQIERLRTEEVMVMEQLKEAERERQTLDDELKSLEAQEKALEAEEAEFWRTHNEHLLAAEQQASQLASLRAAYAIDAATLEKLERTNVYNDAFCIGHDGVFGTINGLRLGRVPAVQVEWAEINAAWGQTLLLLHTIARKLDYSFEHYHLVPMGSFSRIEKVGTDKTVYELYGSGDLHFGRLLHNRRFDIAMVAFLDCLVNIIEHIKSQDSAPEFPHQIIKDKIGDVSIKLQFNQEDAWTRALRHVLLALKLCLKWATNGANG